MMISCRCFLELEYLRVDFSFDCNVCHSSIANNEYTELLQYCQVEKMKVKVDDRKKMQFTSEQNPIIKGETTVR